MAGPGFSVVARLAAPPPDPLNRACGVKPGNACSWVFRQTHNQLLAKLTDFAANRALTVVVIWVVAFFINWVIRRLISRVVDDISGSVRSGRLRRIRDRTSIRPIGDPAIGARGAARAKTTVTVLRSGASIIIYAFALIYTASALGVQLGPLVAGAGVIGVALGFGAQTIVRDFLSGVLLLIEDQFGVGDSVEIQAATGSIPVNGIIEGISLRTTRLRDVRGTVVYIPNGEIRRVGNKSQQWGRAVVDLTVPLESNLAEVESIVAEVAADVKARSEVGDQMLDAPEVWGLETVGPEGMVVRLVAKTIPGSQGDVTRVLRVRSIEALAAAGIRYGRPERLVWVRAEDGVELSPPGPASP